MISAWESLHFATLELVRSTPIKQRLISAHRRYLASIPEDQLPSEVREGFTQMMKCLSGVRPLRGEDSVAASVRKMSTQEADDCANQIVEIFGSTCRLLLNAARVSAEVVQLHGGERDLADRVAAPGEYMVPEISDFDVPALIAGN